MAFGAVYIHLFVGMDKEFFKDMTALKASEFKDRHSLSSPFERFPVQRSGFRVLCFSSVAGLCVSTFEPGTLNGEPFKYTDQTAQSQTRHRAPKRTPWPASLSRATARGAFLPR
jgi:hypothetical protein